MNKNKQETLKITTAGNRSNSVTVAGYVTEDEMKVIGEIYETKDYSIFKFVGGNRATQLAHIGLLKRSFQKKQLLSPILVNENYEVIDGQHRLAVCEELQYPVYFIKVPNYSLEEVHLLNANMKNWNNTDYLNSYAELGYAEYVKMREFVKRFPDFGFAVCNKLLTNNAGGGSTRGETIYKGERVGRGSAFKNGVFKIYDMQLAIENAYKILDFKPYYDGYARSVFVSVMIGLFKNENYQHNKMITKLRNNPSSLVHCTNVEQYKMLIEDIYNFRSRIKVSLRY